MVTISNHNESKRSWSRFSKCYKMQKSQNIYLAVTVRLMMRRADSTVGKSTHRYGLYTSTFTPTFCHVRSHALKLCAYHKLQTSLCLRLLPRY